MCQLDVGSLNICQVKEATDQLLPQMNPANDTDIETWECDKKDHLQSLPDSHQQHKNGECEHAYNLGFCLPV